MKTFNPHSKYEAIMDGQTKLYVMDPKSITLNDAASETVGHPVYNFYSESWKLVNGVKADTSSTWEGRQNSWGMGSNHAGHLLKAIIAQRDAAINLLHDIHDEIRAQGFAGPEVGEWLREALEPKA